MCGIAGQLRLKGGGPQDLRPILDLLRHRGPDGIDQWSDEHCSLGQCRLAVIDLSKGAQAPLSNEDGTIWVTFNGEIYNFQELRQVLRGRGHSFRTDTDTEVIVHAYEEWGAASVERFRGMFAFALWDQRKQHLFLARDRVGKKPLFYARSADSLYFSSEIQGLLAVPDLARNVNAEAIQSYLTWGYVPAPLTGFEGIQKLPPASSLMVELGGAARQDPVSYWSMSYEPKAQISEEQASAQLRDVLTEAVRLRMISDVPLGAFLSGGVDSTVVVGLMAQLSTQPVKTFSIGFDNKDYSELEHARRVANRFGTDHHEHVVRPDALSILPMLVRNFGEPFADSSAIPTYYLSKVTRGFVTVALNGDGGDESFGGYDRYLGNVLADRWGKLPGLAWAARLARAVPSSKDLRDPFSRAERFLSVAALQEASRYSSWMSYFHTEAKKRICTPEFLESASPLSTSDWFEELMESGGAQNPADSAMSVDVRSYLPNDLLVKMDITSMANSLEARSPFLDQDVMEFAARLPMKMKVRHRSRKDVLKKAFADLLPPENVNRPKMGFGVPVGSWFRGPLRELLADTLLSEQSKQRGYFRPEEVQRLVSEHLEEKEDHSARLWSLVMLEMWHREVVEGVREPLADH